MQIQDVVLRTPIIPLAGETYEGMYIMPDGQVDIFMESDFRDYDLKDLITNNPSKFKIRKENATTYIHIQGPKSNFQIYGHLSYDQSHVGNHIRIRLIGSLNVKFLDIEGNDQIIKI